MSDTKTTDVAVLASVDRLWLAKERLGIARAAETVAEQEYREALGALERLGVNWEQRK